MIYLNRGTKPIMKPRHQPSISHTTTIGQVTGQVHTGSGNIHVEQFTAEAQAVTQEVLVAALRTFRENMVATQALPAATVRDIVQEVMAAETAVIHNPPEVPTRLRRVEEILSAVSGSVAAADLFLNLVQVFLTLSTMLS